VLLPGSDASLLAISRGREALEPLLPAGLPPHDAVMSCLDKLALAQAAPAHDLAAPETIACPDAAVAVEAGARLGFPLVLKPVHSVIELKRGVWRSGSVLVDDAATLAALAPDFGEPCLVQRREPGTIVSFAGVLAGGRLLGVAMSRYLRTWYPPAGNVCFSETVAPPAGLSQRIVGLLSALGWEGIFELELIERPDGSYAAIDLNPRVYGSQVLAVRAGANLPALWCDWLLGRDPQPTLARPGVRYRWEDADLRHLLWRVRSGELRAGAAVLRPRRRTVHAYAEARDPGPLAARLLQLGQAAARGRRRSRAGTVAVIGAGPYGLAAVAHLRHAGVPVRVFGEPLEFWRKQMPAGMILRSRRRSSHIADPQRALTIDAYEAATGRSVSSPSLTLEEFIDYGLWFQRRAAPDLDRRKVERLERAGEGFRLVLEDGEQLDAARAVVAAGLFPFGHRPAPFDELPSAAVSHASEHCELTPFSGRSVLVVGSGQSALESAALLREAGAKVEVTARAPGIYWLGDGNGGVAGRRSLRSRLPLPPTDVGGFATGWTAALPDVFRRLPARAKPVVSYRCIRPAGSGWLRPRLEGVPIAFAAAPVEARPAGGRVRVCLSDGSERTVDHVLLGTGYEIDIRRYPFLAPELAGSVEVAGGYPVLGPGLESSVSGLHFLGAPAAHSFGPIMRFVVGTWYAAPSLSARALGRRQRPLRQAF
jgi:predicted ATP-grasp superfamily ATP-dependent carboligase